MKGQKAWWFWKRLLASIIFLIKTHCLFSEDIFHPFEGNKKTPNYRQFGFRFRCWLLLRLYCRADCPHTEGMLFSVAEHAGPVKSYACLCRVLPKDRMDVSGIWFHAIPACLLLMCLCQPWPWKTNKIMRKTFLSLLTSVIQQHKVWLIRCPGACAWSGKSLLCAWIRGFPWTGETRRDWC